MTARTAVLILFGVVAVVNSSLGQKYPEFPSESPANFQPLTDSFDYVRLDEMVPMRDGVRLRTIILIPKGAKNAPILLTRTPYDAEELTNHSPSAHLGTILYG